MLYLKTEPGKKLFRALQEYGAYVADDAGWDAHYFCAERTVPDEVFEAYGLRMHTTEGAFFSDANRLFEALQIVDNNTKDTVGVSSLLPMIP